MILGKSHNDYQLEVVFLLEQNTEALNDVSHRHVWEVILVPQKKHLGQLTGRLGLSNLIRRLQPFHNRHHLT